MLLDDLLLLRHSFAVTQARADFAQVRQVIHGSVAIERARFAGLRLAGLDPGRLSAEIIDEHDRGAYEGKNGQTQSYPKGPLHDAPPVSPLPYDKGSTARLRAGNFLQRGGLLFRFRIALKLLSLAVVALALVGVGLAYVMHSRGNAERVRCQAHLKDLGLFGVRQPSIPGTFGTDIPRDELPPGTFERVGLAPDERMSWYAYTLNAIGGASAIVGQSTRFSGLANALERFDANGKWNSPENLPLARYRLTTAICPAQARPAAPDTFTTANYIALGGLGIDTPASPIDRAGKKAGAYRYENVTPFGRFTDGLHYSAQLVETTVDLGPWLQGGAGTIRGLDVDAATYLGVGRQFGGCHSGGCYVSMADGSVQFVRESVDPRVFRAMLTIAGGPDELGFDGP